MAGWGRTGPKTSNAKEDIEGQEKQQVQKENKFYDDGVRLVKQITRLWRRKMSPALYQAGSLSKIWPSNGRRSIHPVSTTAVSPKLIFEGHWVNLGPLRANRVKSLWNEKLISLCQVEGPCLSVMGNKLDLFHWTFRVPWRKKQN